MRCASARTCIYVRMYVRIYQYFFMCFLIMCKCMYMYLCAYVCAHISIFFHVFPYTCMWKKITLIKQKHSVHAWASDIKPRILLPTLPKEHVSRGGVTAEGKPRRRLVLCVMPQAVISCLCQRHKRWKKASARNGCMCTFMDALRKDSICPVSEFCHVCTSG